jgi:hypothetical protein
VDREGQRRLVLPVGIAEEQLAGRDALALERLGDRMDLGDVEPSARPDEVRDDLAHGGSSGSQPRTPFEV